MSGQETLKLCIRVAVDEDGAYVVGTEHDDFDALISGSDLCHPVATYELEVPVPGPVKAAASIGGETAGPLRLKLK